MEPRDPYERWAGSSRVVPRLPGEPPPRSAGTMLLPRQPQSARHRRSRTIGPADRLARSGPGRRQRVWVWLLLWGGVAAITLP